jgi:effector-binding domain-containing protein
VATREFPSEKVVELLHTGPYDTLVKAYEEVDKYVADHRLIPSGPPREVYLSEPDVPSDQVQTVIEQPIQ